jgi:peptidoglycan/LPS O-acetylase OafA/YrhL
MDGEFTLMEISSKKIDFKILDGLRGIAAVYVVINHCRGNLLMGGTEYAKLVPQSQWNYFTKLYYASLQLTSLGREFVIFFFVLSGFSIAHSLTKNNEAAAFYKRRTVRLYPPYLIALIYAGLVFFFVQRCIPTQLPEGSEPVYKNINFIFSNVFYVPKGSLIPQFWSLTHEVLFYLVIPILFARFSNVFVWLTVAGFVVGTFLTANGVAGSDILQQFLFDYGIFFSIGIMVYKNLGRIRQLVTMKKPVFFLMFTVLFLAMIVTKFWLGEYNRVTPFLSAILSVIMIVNFLHHRIDNLLITFFGKMSYTIYITHFASIFVYVILLDYLGFPYHLKITNSWVWISGVLFCLVMSIPFYYIAEAPTKKLLERMRKNRGAS